MLKIFLHVRRTIILAFLFARYDARMAGVPVTLRPVLIEAYVAHYYRVKKPHLTCSSLGTLSSSLPMISNTSSFPSNKNSSLLMMSTNCLWRKQVAASWSLVHTIVSANRRIPRQLFGCSLCLNPGG